MPVEIRWTIAGQQVTTGGPVTATLHAPDGTVSRVVTGTSGQQLLAEAPHMAGTYTLTVDGVWTTPAGLVHRGEVTRTVTVRRRTPGWVWLGGTGVCGAAVGAWWLWRRYRRLPRLVGRLRVLVAPSDYSGPSLTDLSSLNRRSARIGGQRAEVDLPPLGSPWARIQALPDESGVELTVCNGRVVEVNGQTVAGPQLLVDGDTITTGDVKLRYEHLHYGL